jgi:hypothetical protein
MNKTDKLKTFLEGCLYILEDGDKITNEWIGAFKHHIKLLETIPSFKEYVIEQRSEDFYHISVIDMEQSGKTLEEWFSNMYSDYKIIYPQP